MSAPAGEHPSGHITKPGEVVEKGKIRLPMWMWAIGGAFVIGTAYLIYRQRKAAAAAAAAAQPGQGATSTGYNDPTTILPMFQGSTVTQKDIASLQAEIDGLAPKQPATPTNTYTTKGDVTDNNALNMAQTVYGLKSNQSQDSIIGAMMLREANPQIDWAAPVPGGTKMTVPIVWLADMYRAADTQYNEGDQPKSHYPTWAQG